MIEVNGHEIALLIAPEFLARAEEAAVYMCAYHNISVSQERSAWVESTLESMKAEGLGNKPDMIKAYRKLYWRLGMDPTKRRVCTEALARMVRKSGGIPRINNIVDAVNTLCLKHMVPMSVFDLNTIAPPLELTLARGDEDFRPIGAKVQPLERGMPILKDREKVLMVGYASSDCDYAKVTPETKSVLCAAYLIPACMGLLYNLKADLAGVMAELGAKYGGETLEHGR